MTLRFLHPEIFQGDLKKKNYFEGWYYKHVSMDLQQVYSFIPGISLSRDDSHAFIQVINGITGNTDYITYSTDQFSWEEKSLYLKVGNSVFTEEYIDLDIDRDDIHISGHVEYSNITKYPSSLFSPGIMGWYSFVPFMECKHGIVSVNHDLKGYITINNQLNDFNGGKGYIEKDWGTSFPEAWIWIQSNNFSNHDTSFTFSFAKIPWMGNFFMGFISFLFLNGSFYIFSTYNNSLISEIEHDSGFIGLTMKNKLWTLKVNARKTASVNSGHLLMETCPEE